MGHFIPVIIFVSVLQILVVLKVESYELKCPSQASWKIRANLKCKRSQYYFCLYNNVERKYVEGCKGPDWDRKGSKRIFSGSFTRGNCIHQRFQPFLFWTNGSMSDCVFTKSKCSEEGQLKYEDESANEDRTCRCDYKKSYSFIKRPRNVCYCIPTEEDCSCYVKTCQINQTISSDYSCIRTEIHEILIHKCKDIIEYNKTVDVKTRRCMENNQLCYNQPTSISESRDTAISTMILVFLFVICFCAFFSPTLTIGKLQTLKRYIQMKCKRKRHHGNYNYHPLDGKGHEQELDVYDSDLETKKNDGEFCERTSTDTEQIRLMQAEVHYLQLIHLLFRVACPIVRMLFNHEIKPNQLRSTLDKNKLQLEILYRRKELSDYQWYLLFGHIKGKTVTSEDFGIRLMIYLLRIIANISVGDLYPVQSDTSIGSMLSRIKFIRNEVTQSLEGNISEDQFSKYWDDIRQAVLKLMSSLEMDFENYQHIIGLTDFLHEQSVQIHPGFRLSHGTRKFTAITTEENNFLVVVHGLSKIVYPVVIKEFDTHCRHHMLDTIRRDVFEQHGKTPNYNEHKLSRRKMYLSKKQQQQLFSPSKEESNILDLKLMIYILKENTNKENEEYVKQLDVIDSIRRDILNSSSGVLHDEQFKDIMERICKAVSHVGGNRYMDELASLQRIQNILD